MAINEMNGVLLNGMKLRVGVSEQKKPAPQVAAQYPTPGFGGGFQYGAQPTGYGQPSYGAPPVAAYPGYYPPYGYGTRNVILPRTPASRTHSPHSAVIAAMQAPALPYAPQPVADEGLTTLFVGGLDGSLSEYDMFYAFSTAGPISSIKIPKERGCAFVQFQFHSHADAALVTLQGLQLGSCRLRLAWGRNHGLRLPGMDGDGDGEGGGSSTNPREGEAPGTVEGGEGATAQPVAPQTQVSSLDVLNKVFSAAPLAMPVLAAPVIVDAKIPDEEYSSRRITKQRDLNRDLFVRAFDDDGDATRPTDIAARNQAWALLEEQVQAPTNCIIPRGVRDLPYTNMCGILESGWPLDIRSTVMEGQT
jgi:RNA recognition motif-containing protein